jgi:hypothetical protein
MKLQVAPYNNGAGTWTEAEETAILDYKIEHRFNQPAECTITIADPTGAKAQKYNVDANDVYVGPGKVTIEDPNGTDVFFGRIMKAEADTDRRIVTLYCQDWLSQLDEEQITYDMREDLDGAGLRESVIYPDYDASDGLPIAPAGWDPVAEEYVVYDHEMSWGADDYNGMYMILSDKMAGRIFVTTGPTDYATTASVGGTFTHDIGDLWTDDTDKYLSVSFAAFTDTFKFKVWVPDSDFWQETILNDIRVTLHYKGSTSTSTIQLYNGATYDVIASADTPASDDVWQSITIPSSLVASSLDANGEVLVRLDEPNAGGGGFTVYYIAVTYIFDTIGYSSAIVITDTLSNRLSVDTDLAADATRVWHGVPYSIVQEIYKHIDSAETPGVLITDGDTMETLTCAATIEHTSGISTRQYKDMTRLQILQDLGIQDKAELWIPLGTTTVNRKSTWNDGAPTALTDTDVNSWKSTFDYSKLANEFNIYGMRVGDRQLYSNITDAASILKYKATRSQTKRESGLVSEYDTSARGTALVGQYKDVLQMLTCTIRGNTAKAAHPKNIVLGDEISITSTYLGLAASVYIIDSWSYDSKSDVTTITFHPRVSTTGLQREEFGSMERALQKARKGNVDKVILPPESDIV